LVDTTLILSPVLKNSDLTVIFIVQLKENEFTTQ
jgi:hypothetical protein